MSENGHQNLPLEVMPDEQVLSYLYNTDAPQWERLVCHPSFSIKWVVLFLKRSRAIPRDSIVEIYQNKEWRKSYQISLWLLRCKTAPPALSMNLVHVLRWLDLVHSLRFPYLHGALRKSIEDQIMERLPRLALGEKIALARQAPRPLIRHFRLLPEARVIQALLQNTYFTYEDAIFMANYPKTKAEPLAELARSPRWCKMREIKLALLRNERAPNHCLLPLARTLSETVLQSLLRESRLKLYTRRLIQKVLEERFSQKKKGTAPGTRKTAQKRYRP